MHKHKSPMTQPGNQPAGAEANPGVAVQVAPAATAVVNYHSATSLGAVGLKSRLDEIKAIVDTALIKDQHFGLIPGCGDRPVLFKAGAEALCVNFGFMAEYEFNRMDLGHGHKMYECTCSLIHIESGILVGKGIGSCNTKEKKYKWEFENPANIYNTILKMSKKRALVDAVLITTAASDSFTQDIDEKDNADIVRRSKENEAGVDLAKGGQPAPEKIEYPTEPVGFDTRYMNDENTGLYSASGKVPLRESMVFYQKSVVDSKDATTIIKLIQDEGFRSYCGRLREVWPKAWYGDGQDQKGFRTFIDEKVTEFKITFQNDPPPTQPPAAADDIIQDGEIEPY